MNLLQPFNQLKEIITGGLLSGDQGLGVYQERHQLTLVHAQQGFSGVRVVHEARIPLPLSVREAVEPRLLELISAWGLSNGPVGLAVSRRLGFLRHVTLPLAAADNLNQVVGYELDRFLPLEAEKVYFDFQQLQVTETAIHLTLMALPQAVVENSLALFRNAGLRPISVELAPTAVANAFLRYAPKMPAGFLLLRLEPDGFDLAKIDKRLLVSYRSVRLTSADQIWPRLQVEIDREFGAIAPPEAICVYGQGLSGRLFAELQAHVALPVIRMSQLPALPLEIGREQEAALLPALGAALHGFGKVSLQANLLPPNERAEVKLSGLLLIRVQVIVLISLLGLWLGSALIHQKVTLYQLNQELTQSRGAVRPIDQELQESQALATRLQDVRRRLEKSPSKIRILSDLTRLIPSHTWLFQLRVDHQHLEMSGLSSSAADLIPLLEKSGWLSRTEFISPITTDANGTEHFKIKAEIKELDQAS